MQDSARLGAGGVTSFVFDKGHVFGWQMSIQGPKQRILDSVLPHEVSHTVFATYFRRPLPRWADEGACTTVEHASERAKQNKMLIHFLKSRRGIPFSRMLVMKEYPRDILPLYSQGYSLSRFLIEQGGRPKFVQFIKEGMQDDQWTAAVDEHYGFSSLAKLQDSWLEWVKQGSPRLSPAANDPTAEVIAMATGGAPPRPRSTPGVIYRAQSEDPGVATIAGSAASPASATASPSRAVHEGQPQRGFGDAAVANDHAVGPRWQVAPARNPASRAESMAQAVGTSQPPAAAARDVQADATTAAFASRPQAVIPSATLVAGGRVDSKPRQVLLEWTRPEIENEAAVAVSKSSPPAAFAPAVRTATVDSVVPIRR